MENVNILKKYLDMAIDIEDFGYKKLLIILEGNKKVILSNVENLTKDYCYEYFGDKFVGNISNYNGNDRARREEWCKEDINFLRKNCYSYTLSELAKLLGRKESDIDKMMKKLELFSRRPWTQQEIDFIIQNQHLKCIELANTLRRSIASVKSKKRSLKLKEL